jgi:spore germination protein GerM
MSDLEKKDKPKFKRGFIILIIFIILTIIELTLFIPRIKDSINKSGVREIVSEKKQDNSSNNKETITLYYINRDENSIKYSTTIEKQYDKLHDTFETLLKTPSKSVLDDFNISYIPFNVELLGATQENDAIYVDLSSQILDSKNFDLAYKMLESTAHSFNTKAKFVLLIDGAVYKNSK